MEFAGSVVYFMGPRGSDRIAELYGDGTISSDPSFNFGVDLSIFGWFYCDGRSITTLPGYSDDYYDNLIEVLGGSTLLPDLSGTGLHSVLDRGEFIISWGRGT